VCRNKTEKAALGHRIFQSWVKRLHHDEEMGVGGSAAESGDLDGLQEY
jgi:hypothetical protein